MSLCPIDAQWRAAHPLPAIGDGMDKEERGRALVIGGSAFVPGALLLTGEALLRAGKRLPYLIKAAYLSDTDIYNIADYAAWMRRPSGITVPAPSTTTWEMAA